MERLELLIPPRTRHMLLYIRLFTYKFYAYACSGIAAGAMLAGGLLEKAAHVDGSVAHGGRISNPSKTVSAVGGSVAAHGGTATGVREAVIHYAADGVVSGGNVLGGASVVRLRKLYELDNLTLAQMDGRLLRDLDYVTIEE